MTERYIGDARLDELARISIGLMKEIWLLRDRQLMLERLLEKQGVVERRAIELEEPDARASAEIRLEVDRMIARVFEGAFPAGVPDLESLRARAAGELAAEKKARGD
jgi:hypothetical protein